MSDRWCWYFWRVDNFARIIDTTSHTVDDAVLGAVRALCNAISAIPKLQRDYRDFSPMPPPRAFGNQPILPSLFRSLPVSFSAAASVAFPAFSAASPIVDAAPLPASAIELPAAFALSAAAIVPSATAWPALLVAVTASPAKSFALCATVLAL